MKQSSGGRQCNDVNREEASLMVVVGRGSEHELDFGFAHCPPRPDKNFNFIPVEGESRKNLKANRIKCISDLARALVSHRVNILRQR